MDLKILGLAGIFFIGVLAVGAMATEASAEGILPRGLPFSENHQQVMETIENGDYQAWSELVEGHPIAEQINEENFASFAEMHKHMKQAKEIREELGLPDNGMHRGMREMRGKRMHMIQNCNCAPA
ncbi:hypothetical protein K8R43_02010 [archaeon]|nr:hypothetical protein [archaeon]